MILNKDFIQQKILTKDDVYALSHTDDNPSPYLGFGIIYYAIAHMTRSKYSVCLGSGGGFVPKLMRQAQLDLDIQDGLVTIVDGALPEKGWGEPYWLRIPTHSLNQDYQDIKKLIQTTTAAAEHYFPHQPLIEYLHIDADHSYEGCHTDFLNYQKFLAPCGVITFHDTRSNRDPCFGDIGVPKVIQEIRNMDEWEIIDFPFIGKWMAGMAIVKRRQ